MWEWQQEKREKEDILFLQGLEKLWCIMGDVSRKPRACEVVLRTSSH